MNFSESLLLECADFAQMQGLFCCDAILVAVSGGPDSMCLLHILHSLSEQNCESFPKLFAVHLHHGLRGNDADGDAFLAEKFAQKLGIEFFSRKENIREFAKLEGIGTEEAGRKARYAFFTEIRKQLLLRPYKKIYTATAHHRDDQAETILMHVFRGAGLDGLSGMYPRSENLIRPLLFLSKKQIYSYLLDNDIPYREDMSNTSDLYTRNIWRNKIFPVLRQHTDGDPVTPVIKLSELAQIDQDFFSIEVRKIADLHMIRLSKTSAGLPCAVILSSHPAVQSRLIRYLYLNICGDMNNLEKKHIDSILKMANNSRNGIRQFIPGQRIAYIYDRILYIGLEADYLYEGVSFYRREKIQIPLLPVNLLPECIPVNQFRKGVFTRIAKTCFSIGIFHIENPEKVVYNNMMWCVESDLLENISIRTRRSGDIFSKAGSANMKSLRRLFTDWKIPEVVRDRIMILASGERILWIPGFTHGEGYVDEASYKKYREARTDISIRDMYRIEIRLETVDN